MATGIQVRHSRACATERGGGCSCRPSYRAEVFSRRDGKKIRRTFPTLAAAKSWRVDAQSALGRGRLRASKPTTVGEAAVEFMAGAKAGTIPKKGGGRYKPSSLRSYKRALDQTIVPELGHHKLGEVTRGDVQTVVDKLVAAGWAPSTVSNMLSPLRAIYRRALRRDEAAVDPTESLELAAVTGRRDRIEGPEEAARLLEALPVFERCLYATAAYAGLRRGELRALRRSDVDLAARVIHVRRSWDDVEGEQEDGKSAAAKRDAPVLAPLKPLLAARLLALPPAGDPLVFGRSANEPFAKMTVWKRARAAWKTANLTLGPDEQLAPIMLHELRHTCASTLIAAGANPKVIQKVLGHASITETFDRYGHLMPGGLEDAAKMADAFLARAGVRGA